MAWAIKRFFDHMFNGPAWSTFVLMGVFFGLFGVCSENLLRQFAANYELLRAYGAMAAFDGGFWQSLQLVLWGYLSLAFYVLFKGCLDGLLWRFRHELTKDIE